MANEGERTKRKASDLFDLLNVDANDEQKRQKLDGDAIIRAAQLNPQSVDLQYNFPDNGICFPLHQAILLGAPVQVIEALCTAVALTTALHFALGEKSSFDIIKLLVEKHPEAAKETNSFGDTPLHVACSSAASLDVVSLLYEKWPDSLLQKNTYSNTPLHNACSSASLLEVVSFLCEKCPGALRKKNMYGCTPLHNACSSQASLEMVSLLLDVWPKAAKEKNIDGHTALHLACSITFFDSVEVYVTGSSIEVIKLLIEQWPEAILQKSNDDETPFDLAKESDASEEIYTLLSHVRAIFLGCGMNDDTSNEIMSFFLEIMWWKGIRLLLDKHPTLMRNIDLDIKVMAGFLAMVGCHCSLKTMWKVIHNEQDLLAGV